VKKLLYPTLVLGSLSPLLLLGALFWSTRAHAVDGCKVLLCLAGNWQNISQCRPDVERAMREVAEGRGWPTCDGSSNSSTGLQMTSEATCPAMYAAYGMSGGDSGARGYTGCAYSYVVKVVVSGQPWTDVFWNMNSSAMSTRYYPPARATLGGTIDPTYDNDAAAYVPPPASTVPSCSGDSC
jgi:hypothetical protein